MIFPRAKNAIARTVMTASLAAIAAPITLAAGAAAPESAGTIQLAQRGPGGNDSPEDRKKQRQEKREQRQEQRQERRGNRQEGRQERRELRQQGREQRRDLRQENVQERRDLRQQNVQERRENRDERRDLRQQQREQLRDLRQENVQERRANPQDRRELRQEGREERRDLRQQGREQRRDLRQENVQDRRENREERRDLRQQGREDRRDVRQEGRQERRLDRTERRRWRNEQRDAERRGGFSNIDALKRTRKERRLQGGGSIVEEPDARRIIRSGNRSFIIRDEARRMRRFGNVTGTRRRPGGGNISTIQRPNGVRIITETSPDGRLIRRYRVGRNGRRVVLIDNRRTWRKWGAIGAGAVLATGLLLALDPPRYRMPRDRYIIEYDRASYDDVYDALVAPPIDDVGPGYTLDHVLFNYNLRERMRRIDLDAINFDTGSWDIDESQYDKLEYLARAMGRILDRDPDEVFLIEGHTDAVGDSVSNRSLSDRRAEEVANILSEEFDIPPENLVIQGYGEEFLKVDTDGPSRANRRVTVRRITPLLDRREARYRDDR